jgi:hypothetical protein
MRKITSGLPEQVRLRVKNTISSALILIAIHSTAVLIITGYQSQIRVYQVCI